MTLNQLMEKSKEILKNKGIQSYSLDTCLLMAHFLGKDKLYVLTHKDMEIDNPEGFSDLVNRRAESEPMAYILGEAEFMSLPFKVTPDTLIPRADTETLVEYVIGKNGDREATVLDIGTGSGCIAVSVAKYCKNVNVTALDVSNGALTVAEENAEKNGVSERVSFKKCDILNELPEGKFDFILSNPPYIETDVIPTLMSDVRDFEPYGALWGGDDGLRFYRRISEIAPKLLNKGGTLVFEVGHTQSKEVEELLIQSGFTDTAILKDLAGIERVVHGTYHVP